PQSLQNKLLTTTRMADIITSNTKPGQRRRRFFHRVIFRTLAPGLGKPFTTAPAAEQEEFLRRIQQEVLPNMGAEDLAATADTPRLRLAVARQGTAAQLAELNRQLADGPAYPSRNGELHFDLGPDLKGLVPADLRRVQDGWKLHHQLEELTGTAEGLAFTYRLESRLFDIPGLSLQPPVLELTSRGPSPVTANVAGTDLGGARWRFLCGADLLPQAPAVPVVWDARLVLDGGSRRLASGRAVYPRPEGAFEARAVILQSPGDAAPVYLEAYTTAGGNLSVRQGPQPRFTAVKIESAGDGLLELKLPKDAGAVRSTVLATPAGRAALEHTPQPDGRLTVGLPAAGTVQAAPAGAAEGAVPPFVLEIDCERAGCRLPLRLEDDVLLPLKRPAKTAPAAAAKPVPAKHPVHSSRPSGQRTGLDRLLHGLRRLRRHARRR
ncbi:hypothetical protein HER39_01855, partial [Arthrobacter deserti]|nr:hypothetical protein [Arthrobacter deserti]